MSSEVRMLAVVIICSAVMAVLLVGRVFNQMQLSGYTLRINRRCAAYCLGLLIASAAGCALSVAAMYLSHQSIYKWLGLIFVLIPLIGLAIIDMYRVHKTPLVITKRMLRLYITFIILVSIFGGLLAYYGGKIGGYPLLMPILFAAIPCLAYLSLIINYPMEMLIKRGYLNKAVDTLDKRQNLIKIGITGSYAKTSIKCILADMLSRKFNVVASKNSYNTPMGASLTIKELRDDTEILIMEMGARRKGDIRELCNIIKPNIGVITGIAEQHLATFGSINTIMDTKFELVTSLPIGGTAFFNGNNEYSRKLFYRATLGNKYISLKDSGYIYASNLSSSLDGLDFVLHIGDAQYLTHTALLGKHNIENILLAANVANYLGVSDADIVAAIGAIKYIPHRMEITKANGITIIDDSYNCNPVGAKQAIETVAEFVGRKVVAVQGMVELGNKQYDENYKLGLQLSGMADYVFAIGLNAKAIVAGLIDGGYNPTRIITTETLSAAKSQFSSLLAPGDILLLINDLPDNY